MPDHLLAMPRLRPPSLPEGIVAIPRLRQLLDDAAERPVTLVTGLPGAGKSTLVASWVQHAGNPVAWLCCASCDQDPSSLWAALVAAIEACPIIADGARTGNDEQTPLQISPAELANRLDRADQPLTIVIDDAHVPGEAIGVVERLIDWLPGHVRMILIARCRPALPIPRLLVRGRLTEIRDAELRLTSFETAQILESVGLDVAPQVIDQIHEQSEGWMASVIASGMSFRDTQGPDSPQDAVWHEPPPDAVPGTLAAFFREELLDRLDPPLKQFLLDVCVLEQLTPADCAAVSDAESVVTHLTTLTEGTFPVEQLDGEPRLRLHRQFRAFLQTTAETHAPGHLARQHEMMGTRLEDLGDYAQAAQHYTRAGVHEKAISVVCTSASQGSYATATAAVAAWLGEADLDAIRADPTGQAQVLAASGSILTGSLMAARRWLDRVEALPQPLDTRVDAQQQICRSALCLVEGDLAGAEQHYQVAEHLKDDWPAAWSVIHGLVAARGRLWAGDIDGAQAALSIVDRHPGLDSFGEAAVLGVRSEIAMAEGRPADAIGYADTAIAAMASIGPLNAHVEAGLNVVYLARGLARLEQGKLDTAEGDLAKAHEAAVPSWPAMGAQALCGLARVATARGRVDAAFQMLAHARSVLPAGSELIALLAATEARMDLLAGDPCRAAAVAGGIQDPLLAASVSALQALAKSDHDAARRHLTELKDPRTLRERISHLVLRARVELAQDDRAQARAMLVEALDLAEPQYAVRPFFEDGLELWSLLPPLLARRPRSQFSSALHREANRCRDTLRSGPIPSEDAANRVAQLTPREREILDLLATDQSVRDLAAQLHVSANTMRTHIKSIYRKLAVNSRRDAVRYLA